MLREKITSPRTFGETGASRHDHTIAATIVWPPLRLHRYRGSQLRFEVDGANAARDFLRSHGISERDIEKVWTAIALHTTPGIPEHMHPEIALVQAGAGMDVVGRGYFERGA